jgi:anaerobic magnesium-protoporphyrin IX monomethyl ester cyclase
MRVLLAVPRSCNPKQMYREYPLGVGFLGTILKQQGHEVRIFDENVEGTDDALLQNLVAAFQPEVLGFSVITPNYPVARSQMRRLRELYPELRIMAGGVHASLFPEDLLAAGADVVLAGEGECVIRELVLRLGSGADLSDLPSVLYRSRTGEVARSSGRAELPVLEDLPIVDRALYNLPRYTHHSMLASRGCPHHCAFCCNYTGTLRSGVAVRPYENVISEMEHLRDHFGAREIFFADDIFLLRKADIVQFCRACLARNVGVHWIAQLRADQVDAEVAAWMVRAGCQRVYFGVESGSDTVLRDAHKGITTDQIRRGVRAAKDAGLRVKTGWIYGLPGSLEEQYRSIPFMLELRPHEISIHQLIPFPGTIYYSDAARFGIRIRDSKAFESFCYGGLQGDIRLDYLSAAQLEQLLHDTSVALEAAGYVHSDQAARGAEYTYTTPLSRNSMNVFQPSPAERAVA